MNTYASATKGSEVYVPALHEDGSPTGATCHGTVSAITGGFARVDWVSDGGGSSWFRLHDLEARCTVCKAELDDERRHNGIYHRSCGKASDRRERADARAMTEDLAETDRSLPYPRPSHLSVSAAWDSDQAWGRPE